MAFVVRVKIREHYWLKMWLELRLVINDVMIVIVI